MGDEHAADEKRFQVEARDAYGRAANIMKMKEHS